MPEMSQDVTARSQDLADADHPDKLARILRNAAVACHEAATECATNWQDRDAGKPWTKAARILERAARSMAIAVGDAQ